MLEPQLTKALDELKRVKRVRLKWAQFTVHLQLLDQGRQVLVSTPVYRGTNFIPHSVREAVHSKKFGQLLQTSLKIDEVHYAVLLYYLDQPQVLGSSLSPLLDEFVSIADDWLRYLDQKDQDDHVYSRK